MAKPVPSLRTLLVLGALLVVVAPAGAARAQAPAPQLESFTINAPRVNFLHTVVGGETFTVTVRLDRPAPTGGTRVRVSKLRDSGPIYTLPKEAVIPEGGRSRTFTVETLPIAPGDITPSTSSSRAASSRSSIRMSSLAASSSCRAPGTTLVETR
jgi:hypothetical protein